MTVFDSMLTHGPQRIPRAAEHDQNNSRSRLVAIPLFSLAVWSIGPEPMPRVRRGFHHRLVQSEARLNELFEFVVQRGRQAPPSPGSLPDVYICGHCRRDKVALEALFLLHDPLLINAFAASAGGGLTYIRNAVPLLGTNRDVRATVLLSPALRRSLMTRKLLFQNDLFLKHQ
jgi:hypothetical protein